MFKFDRNDVRIESLGTVGGKAPIRDDEFDVVLRNLNVVKDWAEFCIRSESLTAEEIENLGECPWEGINFYDLSIGFFVAAGVNLIDAFNLARITRYNYQYWESLAKTVR